MKYVALSAALALSPLVAAPAQAQVIATVDLATVSATCSLTPTVCAASIRQALQRMRNAGASANEISSAIAILAASVVESAQDNSNNAQVTQVMSEAMEVLSASARDVNARQSDNLVRVAQQIRQGRAEEITPEIFAASPA